ncbi:terminase small subunit [Massilia sp. IC2-278]|uniref:terminase small subunit n=1 Tax=Massilia sp. IC2-278 TaxID=2887200 RepID=UPI001E3A683C|nr:terminase small subunit [Massilia sp. IC2-278]MCC2962192.1 terminase small subunit [Massilia sp. IC2-278]
MSDLDLSKPMTQAAFGALVGVSQQAIGNLVGRGILDTSVPGHQLLQTYCSHLREQAAGRATNGELDLATERAGLAKAQREKIEMQNAVTRSELAPVALIEEVLGRAGSKIAGIFDAIPGGVRRRVPSLPADEIKNIAAEIARVRNIVAGMSLADLRSDGEEGDDDQTPEEEFLE